MPADYLVFQAGLVAAPVLLALAAWGIFRVTRPKWITVIALVLAATMAVTFGIYWITWGRAFDYTDVGRPVPDSLERTNISSALLFAMSYLLFLAIAIVMRMSSRHCDRGPTASGQVARASRTAQ
jgi:hypothetical protein